MRERTLRTYTDYEWQRATRYIAAQTAAVIKALRTCQHGHTYISVHLADDQDVDGYDQDTAERRCERCGKLVEDLSV